MYLKKREQYILIGGDLLIHWYWAVVALIAGIFIGVFFIALLATAKDEDEQHKWWR